MPDSDDFRCTPSRAEPTLQGHRGPLQFRVPNNGGKTKICQARISRAIYEHIPLKLMNERNIHKEMGLYTG